MGKSMSSRLHDEFLYVFRFFITPLDRYVGSEKRLNYYMYRMRWTKTENIRFQCI